MEFSKTKIQLWTMYIKYKSNIKNSHISIFLLNLNVTLAFDLQDFPYNLGYVTLIDFCSIQ